MIASEAVSALLTQYLELMETLKGRQLGGFALIVPPEGDPITSVFMAETADVKMFYALLKDQLAESQGPTPSGYGGVAMPRGMR